jgi:hypothetical protein
LTPHVSPFLRPRILCCLLQKYDTEFEPFFETFVQDVWALMTNAPDDV